MGHRVSPSSHEATPDWERPNQKRLGCGADAGMLRPGMDLAVPRDGLEAPTSPGVTRRGSQPARANSQRQSQINANRGSPTGERGRQSSPPLRIANRHNARKSRQERETSSPTPRQPTTKTGWGGKAGTAKAPTRAPGSPFQGSGHNKCVAPKGSEARVCEEAVSEETSSKSRGGLKGGQSPTPAASDQTRAQRRAHPHKKHAMHVGNHASMTGQNRPQPLTAH